jgi:phenylacetate-CoA ligase
VTMFGRIAESLYAAAPPRLRDIALSGRGLLLNRERFGGDFTSLYAEACAATFSSREETRLIQERLWSQHIRPALPHVRAYGRSLELSELSSLPVITKSIVREQLADFVRQPPPPTPILHAHTSGTTGAGLRFPVTRHAHRRQWAFWWRYRQWHGISRDEWCAVFGGRTVVPPNRTQAPFWHVNAPGRSVLFSQYHLTPEHGRLYLAEIRRRGIRWIHGYPSLVSFLAQVGLEAGLAGSLPVQWITVGAENLLTHQRSSIERMFGVVPRQHYGMAEGVANISECPQGTLHVDEDYSVVEFLRREGGPGYRIIGTSLDNDAMPLLRYDVGDVASLPEQGGSCICGHTGRIIETIDGRQEDYLLLSDGTRVGRVDHFFKDAVRVREAQVMQTGPGEATIRVVKGDGYTNRDEQAIRKEIQERLGERLRFDIDYVAAIPRGPNGKLRLVVQVKPTRHT